MYNLTKISSPGFELSTSSISVVERILQGEVCDMCKYGDGKEGLTTDKNFYETLLENRDKLYVVDKYKNKILPKENKRKLEIINGLICEALMGTSCGAEYWLTFEGEDDITEEEHLAEYFTQQEEYFEEYNKMIEEGFFDGRNT